MYLGEAVFASELLKQPTLLDDVDDDYLMVIIEESTTLWSSRFSKFGRQRELDQMVMMMHERGWETVDITFPRPYSMVALLLNPRAKYPHQPQTEG